MKKRLQKGFILSALIAVCIANTPAEAGFGSAMGKGLFKSSGSGYGGSGYDSDYYEQERKRQEEQRQKRETEETRKYMVFGGMILLGVGWINYARSRRKQSESFYNEQRYVQPVVQPKSQILSYDPATQKGKLTTPEGKRYEFNGEDVASGFSGLQFGVKVDFDLSESETPINIRPADMETNSSASNNAAIAQSQNIASDKPNIVMTPWFMALLYAPTLFFFLLYLLEGITIFHERVDIYNPPFWMEVLAFVYLLVIMKFTPLTLSYDKIQAFQQKGKSISLVHSRLLPTVLLTSPISLVLAFFIFSMTRNEFFTFIVSPLIVGIVLYAVKGISISTIEKENTFSDHKRILLKPWMTSIILFPSLAFFNFQFLTGIFGSNGIGVFFTLLTLVIAISFITAYNPSSMTISTTGENQSDKNA